jgi:hypothetical protein
MFDPPSQMFEGRQPYEGMDPIKAAAAAASNGLRPTFLNKNIPPKVKELIEELWDPIAQRRPNFMEVLARFEVINSQVINSRRPCTLCPLLRPYHSTPSPGGCSGQRACQHAQLGIPETAHGPTLEYRQLPHGSSTHSLTRPAG